MPDPHECREQALAAQVELLTHRLVECRMVNDLLQRQHLDDERRMREQGGPRGEDQQG